MVAKVSGNRSRSALIRPLLRLTDFAQVAFSDAAGRHCITKVDYNAKGPAVVYTVGNEE